MGLLGKKVTEATCVPEAMKVGSPNRLRTVEIGLNVLIPASVRSAANVVGGSMAAVNEAASKTRSDNFVSLNEVFIWLIL